MYCFVVVSVLWQWESRPGDGSGDL